MSYEAEDADSIVAPAKPDAIYMTMEAESSQRSYRTLQTVGDSIHFNAKSNFNRVTLRYSVPDSADGKGASHQISLLINGTLARKLSLTSKYAWVYGDFPWSNDPKDGRPHKFFDEISVEVPASSKDDVISFVLQAEDTKAPVTFDFIDLEWAPEPRESPTNSLSLLDFGAIANDQIDDSMALEQAIKVASQQSRTLWIPAGNFQYFRKSALRLPEITIEGAGLWHSTIFSSGPMFKGSGNTVSVSHLTLRGNITQRRDTKPDDGFNGNFGSGSEIAHVWIEHYKCGIWTTHGTNHLKVSHCRIRNTMADGINLCDGTNRSTVEFSHMRNTGDDGIATWSPLGDWSSKQPCYENQFLYNHVQLPWLANGIAIYGGGNHLIQGNRVVDTVYSGGGLHISSGHGAYPFFGTIEVMDNALIRTGGDAYIGEKVGSLWINASDSDIEAKIIIDSLSTKPNYLPITVHGKHKVMGLEHLRLK